MIDLDRHARIMEQLHSRGLSFSAIARAHGCSVCAVVRVSQGHSRSKPVEARLAAALDTTPERLFPGRYPAHQPTLRKAA